jgi:hypothetical protein
MFSKVDELRARISFQGDLRGCNILCFTELQLSSQYIPQTGIKSSPGRRGDVFFRTNHSWCDCDNVQKLKSFCSPDLEYLTIKC